MNQFVDGSVSRNLRLIWIAFWHGHVRSSVDLDTDEGKQFLHKLFRRQLKSKGARQVIHFELWAGNKHVYTIFFTSGNTKGCDVMKQAIWKAQPNGTFQLRGSFSQPDLSFFLTTDMEPLAKQLKEEFGDSMTPIEDIEEFVKSDKTQYHSGHLRQKTLRPLENQGRIEVSRPKGTLGFPPGRGVMVRFN